MNLNRLDLNLLVALDALLSERSITKAGQRLHLSPSATSGALARLRDYFGDELLSQIGRRMIPTPLGESLQVSVRNCLLNIQATIDSRPGFDPAQSQRRFTLMMSDYVSAVIMPHVLQRLEQEAPNVEIQLLANQDPALTLERGDTDFLIIPERFVLKGHPAEPLFDDEFVCVCWQGNPLVGESLSLEQFLNLSHVVARIGTERPPTIDAWFFERFGHVRRIGLVAMTFTAVPHLLVGTHRIALMHRRLAKAYLEMLPLRMLPSPCEMPRLIETIQWHRHRESDPGRVWMHEVLKSAAALTV